MATVGVTSSHASGIAPSSPRIRPATPEVHVLVARVLSVFAIAFVVYLGWLSFGPNFTYSSVLNGWLPDSFELVVASICVARGLLREPGRAAAVFLGLGLLSWGLGDCMWTLQGSIGVSNWSIDLGTGLWLGFYPLAYVALVVFLRDKLVALTTPTWLDGVVAALGTAALCAAFAFHGVHGVSQSALGRATNIAYPLGDMLLLAIAVGGAVLSGRASTPWVVLAFACVLNCIGDTANLFQSTEGHLRADAIFHALAWPAAGLLMTTAIWMRPRRMGILDRQRPTGLLLPGLAASFGLATLFAGSLTAVSRVALGLAVASLIVAGIRLLWSAQGLRSLTEQRHRQSMTDELTGLGNRRHLGQVIDALVAGQAKERETSQLFFLFVDLNHFKEINDSFGHTAGDELLKQIGPRLSTALSEADVLVRLGGDEFGIVLSGASTPRASEVAESITTQLLQPFDLNGVRAHISASIGIASTGSSDHDIAALLEAADVAMFRAKLEGRPFAFYDEHLDQGSQWRLGDELRHAIDRSEFELHYQAQLDLKSGEQTSFEALVRWHHPKLGMLWPSRFLPLAEHAGLMPALTELLLNEALATCNEWRLAGRPWRVAVNVSAINLLDDTFASLVGASLARHRISADALVLEITETSVIANFERARLVIGELAALGVVVSIDDFGAGFTSLSYLSRLEVRELKLDSMLITGLSHSVRDRDRLLVKSTIDLGHSLGLRVVAEGVEDAATLALLTEFGCDLAQGYVIAAPAPATELSLLGAASHSTLLA